MASGEHRSERSSHATYGLIITSALVADREHAADALTSLTVLWGAGLVLDLAHIYSATVAEVGTEGRWLFHAERHVLIVDNIPVLAALVVPSILLIAAWIWPRGSGPGHRPVDHAVGGYALCFGLIPGPPKWCESWGPAWDRRPGRRCRCRCHHPGLLCSVID